MDAAPRRYPSTVGGAVYLLVVLVTLSGLVVAVVSDWRTGIRIVCGALAVAAAVRLVLPDRDAGMLAVRHRFLDVGTLLLFAGALLVLTATIPDQPGS